MSRVLKALRELNAECCALRRDGQLFSSRHPRIFSSSDFGRPIFVEGRCALNIEVISIVTLVASEFGGGGDYRILE